MLCTTQAALLLLFDTDPDSRRILRVKNIFEAALHGVANLFNTRAGRGAGTALSLDGPSEPYISSTVMLREEEKLG